MADLDRTEVVKIIAMRAGEEKGVVLQGVDLSEQNLSALCLVEANLKAAKLNHANLTQADLTKLI